MDLLLNLGWMVLDSGEFFSPIFASAAGPILHAWRVRCVYDSSAMGCVRLHVRLATEVVSMVILTQVWAYGKHE
jgi:hypothetical protein